MFIAKDILNYLTRAIDPHRVGAIGYSHIFPIIVQNAVEGYQGDREDYEELPIEGCGWVWRGPLGFVGGCYKTKDQGWVGYW